MLTGYNRNLRENVKKRKRFSHRMCDFRNTNHARICAKQRSNTKTGKLETSVARLIVGCGYVGKRLAKYWQSLGDDNVFVTTRSASRAHEFERAGFKPIVYDVTEENQVKLPTVETLVFAVGFDRTTGHSVEEVYVEGLRRLLDANPQVQRFIYISSTGVYGQTDGGWVDEKSECNPKRDGGKACLAAELLLESHETFGAKTVILRMAGIYGPDRLPMAAVLQRGEPLKVAADAHLNLIHVDDIVRVIAACEEISTPEKFCVSDGQPVLRRDFYEYLARELGTSQPTFEAAEPGSSRAERARGSKRIKNDRMVAQLKPSFRYPSYREGLTAIVGDKE